VKRLLMTASCMAVAAFGGNQSGRSTQVRRSQASTCALSSARDSVFAADASHSAIIEQLGPVEGLLRAMRGNALYLAAGIDIVQGKQDIRAALIAAEPDPARTSLRRTVAGGDVSRDGRFGFTFGWIEKTATLDGRPTTYGTYVSTWEREDGEPFRVTAYFTRDSSTRNNPTRDGFRLLLAGSGAGGIPRPGSLDRQKRSLLRTDEEFAAYSVANGLSPAFPVYAADLVMHVGQNFFFLLGSEEITDFYGGGKPHEVLDWTPQFAGSSPSGDLGFTVGKSVDSVTNPDGRVDRFYGKYLTLWARQANGAWRFIADGGASSPSPG
jgi:ketosteroid isomerase-like protein